MLTLVLSLLTGVILWFALNALWPGHPVWNSVLGVLGFMGTTILINLLMRKHLEAIFKDVQTSVMDTQERLKRKITMLQNKMQGGPKLQAMIEKEQAESIRETIKILDRVAPLKKWNVLAARQADTLRGQLLFQIKDFEAADPFLDKALVLEPLTLAMQMTRWYKRGKMDDVSKAFKKGVKRFKDEKATLIYALYSWILLTEGRQDEAVVVLDEGKTKTENETLKQNWDHLVNNRPKRFSNAGLGEQWYALYLEQPKAQIVRSQAAFGGPGMGGRRSR
ncbi:MAG: tetratricopeptide repeat protein [Lentisphaeria bacterium]